MSFEQTGLDVEWIGQTIKWPIIKETNPKLKFRKPMHHAIPETRVWHLKNGCGKWSYRATLFKTLRWVACTHNSFDNDHKIVYHDENIYPFLDLSFWVSANVYQWSQNKSYRHRQYPNDVFKFVGISTRIHVIDEEVTLMYYTKIK